MTRRTPLAASLLLLASTVPSYAAFFLPINTTLIIPTGDAFFSAAGVDSAGNTIGTDCILASPCQTPQKALAFQAANIASNPAQSLKFYFIDRGGMFFVPSTLVYNSHHTVSSGFTVSWLAYPGQHPIFSGGRDIHGTWTAATPIPNGSGINGCVSNALAGSAPLVDGTTTTNAGLYVGAAWFNGLWTAEVIQPRIGSPADVVPGTAGTIPTEASIAQGPTASFTSGSTSVGISDLSKIGIVGQTLMFDTAQDGFTSFFDYFILSKSAATGAGTITLSSTGPTGSAVSATGTGAGIQVSDATQTVNHGGRTATSGINQFPVNAGYNTATNQTDVKVWMSVSNGASPSLIPVAAATSSQVTLASRWSLYRTLYSGTRIRRWNVFEDLGTLGKSGELYTNRTTGAIYYTPRSGETCSSINAPGYVIIPTNPEILLKISSATFDGSVNAAPVGNFIINGIAFEHANNSTLTGVHNLNGFVGGYIGGGGQSSYSMGDAAVTMVGATNVDLENVVIQHVASSGLNVAWGSNHVTVNNLVMGDVGGHGILTGMGNMTGNNYQYETDAGYYGTFALGPSTPSLNTSGAPHNVDLTGNSDCCNIFTNISMLDVGKVNNGGACMAVAGWQSDVVDHNRFLRCPGAGFQEDGDGLLTVGAPSYSGNGASYAGVMLTQVYNNDFSYNEIGYVGAETDLSGNIIPGSPGFSDFGAFYIRAPQDGLADGSSPTGLPLTVKHNIVHDISNGCIQNVQSGGTIQPHGLNAVLDYMDGDNTHGVISQDNLFYNSALVNGIAPCPGNMTQHTGGFRNTFKNNIYAGTYPAGYAMPGDYGPRGDIGPYPMQPFRSMAYTCATSNVCYTINLGRLYSATVSGTSGSTAATVPTCTSGACSVDGTMTWTFVENLPGASFQSEVNNITGWAVAGGGGSNADFPQGAQWFAINPQFTKTDDSIYWESGSVMTFYNNQGSHTLFSAWVALGQDVTTNTLGGFNCNPNFIDMSGASGYAGFQPNPSGCPGLGYVWPDFSTVGPQNGPPPPPPSGNFFAKPDANTVLSSTKMVFAHYVPNDQLQNSQTDYWPNSSCMINQLQAGSNPGVGGNQRTCAYPPITGGSASTWKVDNFVKDITRAIAQGINGFVLDIGNAADWAAGGNLQAMLNAAAQVDSRFKIVPMPDTGYEPAISPTTVPTLFSTTMVPGGGTIYNHPNIYRWPATGQPQLSVLNPEFNSAYTAAQWQTALTSMATAGTPVAWLPAFNSIADAPTYVTGITQSVGVANFGNPGIPDQYFYAQTNSNAISTSPWTTGCGGHQCSYMGGFTSQGWQIAGGGSTNEAVNLTAWRYGWMGSIAYLPSSNPLFNSLMLVTWNDHGESHSMQPSQDAFGNVNRGMYDLTSYYATWWRNGSAPPITGDAIFYAYRKQTYAAGHAATDPALTTRPTLPFGTPEDNIEMLAFLTAPATMQVVINGATYTQSGIAGLNTMGKAAYTSITSPPTPAIGDATVIPLQAGTPTFSLIRGGSPVLSLQGMPTYGNAQLPAFNAPSGVTLPNSTCSSNPCFPAGLPDVTYYSNDTTPATP